ncbi:MAG: hypothetical protein J0M35_19240 [Candidatus Obscuribacter phosphatis]|uniref:Uncharacterized protein n=1 Tax=Candidatus Obscuribacter phosphatis TaxID=1906157 RepID=A0A8J7TNW4_9BACT|nr:hypothetical protein [Candidatus Obscuribacter phosphatis]
MKEHSYTNAIGDRKPLILDRDPPFLIFFGIPFFLIGLLFFVAPWGLASNSDSLSIPIKLVISGMGTVAMFVSLIVFRSASKVSVLDRGAGCVIVRQRLDKRSTRRINISEIADVILDTSKDSDGENTYRSVLLLKSGEKVGLSNAYIYDEAEAKQKVAKISALIRDPYASSFDYKRPTSPVSQSGGIGKGVVAMVCATVIASPFVSWWIAANSHQPAVQDSVVSGAPSPALDKELHLKAAEFLPVEEKIVFVTTPEPGHEGMVKIWFIPFAIVWTLFSLLWLTVALGSSVTKRSITGIIMSLFGLPFAALGIGMLLTPYFSYMRELTTIYAISEKRAFAVDKDGARELVAFDDKHFGPINASTYTRKLADGKSEERMDLLFRNNLDPEGASVTVGFWGIDKGAEVKAILEEKYRAKN